MLFAETERNPATVHRPAESDWGTRGAEQIGGGGAGGGGGGQNATLAGTSGTRTSPAAKSTKPTPEGE